MDMKELRSNLVELRPVVGTRGIEQILECAGRPDGWDKGKGRKLQAASMRTFVELGDTLPPLTRGLSVELTLDGNLSFSFLDTLGKSAELDFLPDGYYLYSEQLDGLEREFEKSERGELLKLLRKLV